MECLKLYYVAAQDIYVPCGKCVNCRTNRASEWNLRFHYESKRHGTAYFITLTYNQWFLPINRTSLKPTLNRADLKKYINHIRKKGYKIRYYAVGEYGTEGNRPHYHLIVWGEVPQGILNWAWHYYDRRKGKELSLGIVDIRPFNEQRGAYIAGYLQKSIGQTFEGRVRPFARMSLKPGIGANYLSSAMVAWHKPKSFTQWNVYTVLYGQKLRLPRYYRDKIFSTKLDKVRVRHMANKRAVAALAKFARDYAQHPNAPEYYEQRAHFDAENRIARAKKTKQL